MSAPKLCSFNRLGTCKTGALCTFSHIPCSLFDRCDDSTCQKGHPQGWAPPGGQVCNTAVRAPPVALSAASSVPKLEWQVFDPASHRWDIIPNRWVSDSISEHYDKKDMTFELTVKQVVIRFDLNEGIEEWVGVKQHMHIRALDLVTSKCVVGGDSRCAKCARSAPEPERGVETTVEWSSYDPRKFVWVPYDDRAQRTLEAARKKKLSVVELELGGIVFQVNLQTCVQQNDRGGHRHVRRLKGGAVKDGGEKTCSICSGPQGHSRGGVQAALPACSTATMGATRGGPAAPQHRTPSTNPPVVVDDNVVQIEDALRSSPLLNRTWVPLAQPQPFPFVVMQWNVLFSTFAAGSKNCCPERYLEYEHRLKLQIHYMSFYHADIVTLQEVENPSQPTFQSFIRAMKDLGYDSAVMPKCRQNADACGVFWKSSRFQLLQAPLQVSFAQASASNDVQVGIAVRLNDIHAQKCVTIATTHLKAAKLDEADRVSQMRLLLDAILAWAPPGSELIVCGDFNTSPKWDLVPLLSSGMLLPDLSALKSVYLDHQDKLFTDRAITVYMPHTQDMVDYIFHTERTVALDALKIPGERDIVSQSIAEAPKGAKFRQLPIPSFPSDHFPLVCRFAIV